MAFFGPTLTELGADPNSPAVRGSSDTSGDSSGGFLNEISTLIGIGSTAAVNLYRTVNMPTPAQPLLPGQSYLLPNSGGVVRTAGASNSNLFLIAILGFLILLGIKMLRK